MSELKPCPRCGAEANVVTESGEPTIFLCESCGYWLDVSEFDVLEDAFKWWNDRPIEDELRKRIAELEEVGNELALYAQIVANVLPPEIASGYYITELVYRIRDWVNATRKEREE